MILFAGKSQNIKAFTIMEMLVALTLAGIVIASGGMLYFQFNRYLSTSINMNESENSVILFSLAFRNDIRKSSNITAKNEEIIVLNSDASSVSYSFFDKYVVRSIAEKTDTFKMLVNDLSISTELGSDRFYSVKANLVADETVYPFFLVKEYENFELFNKK